MNAFRDFELGRWADPSVCQAYHDQLGGLITQSIDPLLDVAQVGPQVSVLDVATGVGVVAASAAERGASVVGIDFSAEQLRRARELHPGITFEPGEADALPFGPSSFDAVVSNFGVPHFPDPEKFIQDGRRVLRPGGWLAFTVWARPDLTKVYGAIMHAVERFGSFDVGLPAGPDIFRYADAAQARARASKPAGSTQCRSRSCPRSGSSEPRTTRSSASWAEPLGPLPFSSGRPRRPST